MEGICSIVRRWKLVCWCVVWKADQSLYISLYLVYVLFFSFSPPSILFSHSSLSKVHLYCFESDLVSREWPCFCCFFGIIAIHDLLLISHSLQSIYCFYFRAGIIYTQVNFWPQNHTVIVYFNNHLYVLLIHALKWKLTAFDILFNLHESLKKKYASLLYYKI